MLCVLRLLYSSNIYIYIYINATPETMLCWAYPETCAIPIANKNPQTHTQSCKHTFQDMRISGKNSSHRMPRSPSGGPSRWLLLETPAGIAKTGKAGGTLCFRKNPLCLPSPAETLKKTSPFCTSQGKTIHLGCLVHLFLRGRLGGWFWRHLPEYLHRRV